MKNKNQLERLTILVGRNEIRRIKHIAVDQRSSTSEIVREAVKDYLGIADVLERDASTKTKAQG